MDKEKHNCDNVNCNHNNTKGLCCLFNPDNCKYRQLQKENANLKDVIEGYKKIVKWCDKCDKLADLEKENAELKAFKEKCKFNVNDIFKDIETEKQLTKAKELLAKWVELFKPKLEGYPITPIQEQTEQFLSEVEK